MAEVAWVRGALCDRIVQATQRAISAGTLQSITTTKQIVMSDGVPFVLRLMERKGEKRFDTARAPRPEGFNPFLPYEETMYVCDVGERHVCLLNKFNVVDRHILIVTKEYEEQTRLLNLHDFVALADAMAEFPALAFYNCGKIAGASQHHKHIQMVPLPLGEGGLDVPISAALSKEEPTAVQRGLSFRHNFCWLQPQHWEQPQELYDRYSSFVDALGLRDGEAGKPYNLLVTRDWMMVVPRQAEDHEGVVVNSFGFFGALLVRDQEQLDWVIGHGAMRLLAKVGFPNERWEIPGDAVPKC
jgi:ATP adenylyltransferase